MMSTDYEIPHYAFLSARPPASFSPLVPRIFSRNSLLNIITLYYSRKMKSRYQVLYSDIYLAGWCKGNALDLCSGGALFEYPQGH
jgi:hypothetical protein